MKEPVSQLVESLREELKQYGEMLALLDHQQNLVTDRRTSDLLQSVTNINAQVEVIHAARREREQHQRHLAQLLHLNPAASFAALVPLTPPGYRPLLEALIQENNALLTRIQQRARQNHLLLTRVVDLMQRFINALSPAPAPPLYNVAGIVTAAPAAQPALFEAIV